MKMRHRETGEMINLPDFIPEYEEAKEIARVFMESADLTGRDDLPPDIVCLKTHDDQLLHVSHTITDHSYFPYERLICIHLHLPPFKYFEQTKKSIVWSVLVNGHVWSVGDFIFDHVIVRLEWTKEFGWWAITDSVYAVRLGMVDG